MELQHVEFVDLHIDVDVGLLGLQFFPDDRPLQDLGRCHQRGEGRRCRLVGLRDGRAADIDCHDDVGIAFQNVERERIDEASIHQQPAIARDGGENGGQGHAGGNGTAQIACGHDDLVLSMEVGGDQLQRNAGAGKIPRHFRGQHEVQQQLRLQQRRADRQNVEESLHRLGARCQQIARKAQALGQDLFGMRLDELGREPRGVGGAEQCAYRCAGNDLRLDAKLVEHLEHENVRKPARAAAAQGQAD